MDTSSKPKKPMGPNKENLKNRKAAKSTKDGERAGNKVKPAANNSVTKTTSAVIKMESLFKNTNCK